VPENGLCVIYAPTGTVKAKAGERTGWDLNTDVNAAAAEIAKWKTRSCEEGAASIVMLDAHRSAAGT